MTTIEQNRLKTQFLLKNVVNTTSLLLFGRQTKLKHIYLAVIVKIFRLDDLLY